MKKKIIEDLGNIIDGKHLDESEAVVTDAAASLEMLCQLLDEENKTEGIIKALRDTDYKDADAQFKMVQLLKGLAVAAKDDDTAKKYLSAVSDALTTAAKSVLGEDEDEDADGLDEEKRKSQGEIRIFHMGGYGQPEKYEFGVRESSDKHANRVVAHGSGPTAKKAFEKAFKVCKDDYGWE